MYPHFVVQSSCEVIQDQTKAFINYLYLYYLLCEHC